MVTLHVFVALFSFPIESCIVTLYFNQLQLHNSCNEFMSCNEIVLISPPQQTERASGCHNVFSMSSVMRLSHDAWIGLTLVYFFLLVIIVFVLTICQIVWEEELFVNVI